MKTMRFLGLLFLIILSLTFLTVSCKSGSGEQQYVRIEIESGESVRSVSEKLKGAGIIRSTLWFRWYMSREGLDRGIQPGTFVLVKGSSYTEISEALSEGKQATVTIPEGYTIVQLDKLLTDMGLIEEGEIIECSQDCNFDSFGFLMSPDSRYRDSFIEGYLFPDTYYVDVTDFVPKFFLERLLGTFRHRVVEDFVEEIEASKRSLHEIVIMASLIERETSADVERGMVSGILWKRLDAEQGLAVDATVRYILNKPTGALTRADLETDSSYNTRKYRGLPPGPIANPGLKSIEAALNPEDSPYWYYLHGSDGKIHYSETNEEHNEKKVRYL